MENVLVSYITVCFNSKETIADTIRSVLNQTDNNYEYIIVDGGSTDGTKDIIQQFVDENGNIAFISEQDNGIYDAMNKGIKIAKGDLVCMINSDDWLEKDAVETVRSAYTGEELEVIYGMQRTITAGKEENCIIYNHNFISKHMLCHQACYVTKECFDQFGMFSLNYKSVSDYEFMLRLYNTGKVKFTPVYKVLVNFRSGGMSNSYVAMEEAAKLKYDYHLITKKKKMIDIIKAKLMKIGLL